MPRVMQRGGSGGGKTAGVAADRHRQYHPGLLGTSRARNARVLAWPPLISYATWSILPPQIPFFLAPADGAPPTGMGKGRIREDAYLQLRCRTEPFGWSRAARDKESNQVRAVMACRHLSVDK